MISGIKVLLYERSPRSNGPRSPWAIKKFANGTSRDSKQIASRLEHEAKIMKTFDHPNIIGYRGFKINADGSRVLALETGKKCCSLYDWIEEVRDDETTEAMEPMPAEKIAFVVREVAKGLDYLHKQKRYNIFTLFYFLQSKSLLTVYIQSPHIVSIQNFISIMEKTIFYSL